MDAIESIQGIGFTQLDYVPYSPEVLYLKSVRDQIDRTLCVGEPRLVPPGFGPVYDIGTRILLLRPSQRSGDIWAGPWKSWKISQQIYGTGDLHDAKRHTASMSDGLSNKNLLSLINSINDGMMVYDQESGRISVFNNQLRNFRITEDGEKKSFTKF